MSSVSLALNVGKVAAASAHFVPDASYIARGITLNKAHQFALGSLAILAISELPKAEAGPVAEITCMAACAAAALTGWGAIWYGTCMQACALLGFAPGP